LRISKKPLHGSTRQVTQGYRPQKRISRLSCLRNMPGACPRLLHCPARLFLVALRPMASLCSSDRARGIHETASERPYRERAGFPILFLGSGFSCYDCRSPATARLRPPKSPIIRIAVNPGSGAEVFIKSSTASPCRQPTSKTRRPPPLSAATASGTIIR
jgi:hypothetical protein